VDAIRDGVTVVTATGRLESGSMGDNYDAIVIAFGRSAKENERIASGLTSAPHGILAKAVIFGAATDSIGGLTIKYTRLSEVSRVENLGQLGAFVAGLFPEDDHAAIAGLDPSMDDLTGAKVLIVDDDIRNIYSLTSVLETYGIDVVHAERGRDGIALLQQSPDIDIALVDIMMPEMDGYETMRQIRRLPGLANLPLISVTAKAMKGDRQKCLEAGASDYIAKPVDLDLLLALLRVWIGRARANASNGRAAAQ
jgi:CheY-like chemotaxis protein